MKQRYSKNLPYTNEFTIATRDKPYITDKCRVFTNQYISYSTNVLTSQTFKDQDVPFYTFNKLIVINKMNNNEQSYFKFHFIYDYISILQIQIL